MARVFASDRGAHFPSDGRRVVVPVPTTERRVRERGYNQAALLAERVGRDLRIPVRRGLVRVPGGPSQTSLRAEARRENVRGVFRAGSASVADAHVLLVDDVLTTGATAGEAATVLRASGAATVVLLTFARALQDLSGG
jgi:ComF family protein